jgi:heterodisulfide reductase subunit C
MTQLTKTPQRSIKTCTAAPLCTGSCPLRISRKGKVAPMTIDVRTMTPHESAMAVAFSAPPAPLS